MNKTNEIHQTERNNRMTAKMKFITVKEKIYRDTRTGKQGLKTEKKGGNCLIMRDAFFGIKRVLTDIQGTDDDIWYYAGSTDIIRLTIFDLTDGLKWLKYYNCHNGLNVEGCMPQ